MCRLVRTTPLRSVTALLHAILDSCRRRSAEEQVDLPLVTQAVIQAALADAGTQLQDVAALQLHGTGTSLGDPIETGSAAALFCQRTDRNCADHKLRGQLLCSEHEYNGHLQSDAHVKFARNIDEAGRIYICVRLGDHALQPQQVLSSVPQMLAATAAKYRVCHLDICAGRLSPAAMPPRSAADGQQDVERARRACRRAGVAAARAAGAAAFFLSSPPSPTSCQSVRRGGFDGSRSRVGGVGARQPAAGRRRRRTGDVWRQRLCVPGKHRRCIRSCVSNTWVMCRRHACRTHSQKAFQAAICLLALSTSYGNLRCLANKASCGPPRHDS